VCALACLSVCVHETTKQINNTDSSHRVRFVANTIPQNHSENNVSIRLYNMNTPYSPVAPTEAKVPVFVLQYKTFLGEVYNADVG